MAFPLGGLPLGSGGVEVGVMFAFTGHGVPTEKSIRD